MRMRKYGYEKIDRRKCKNIRNTQLTWLQRKEGKQPWNVYINLLLGSFIININNEQY